MNGLVRRSLPVSSGLTVVVAVAVAVSAFDAAQDAGGSPVVPPGIWHGTLQTAIVAGFAAYVVALLALGGRGLAFKWAVAIGAAIQAFPLLGPKLLSTDVGVYAAYGRMAALENTSPYVESTANQFPSVYGPLFTMGSELIALVTRDSEDAAVLIYRVGAVGAVLAVGWLASRLATNRSLAVALVTWNPLLAFHFGGGGHNDALMVAFALLALVLASRERLVLSGALWAVSISIKLFTVALLPIEALALWRRSGTRVVTRALIGFGLAALGIIALASLLYGTTWLEAIRTLSDVGSRRGSIGLSHWLDMLGFSEGYRGRIIQVAQLSTVVVLSAAAARTGHARLGLAATLLAVFQGWLNPWYAVWGLGFAAADDHDRAGRVLAVALSGYLLIDITTW